MTRIGIFCGRFSPPHNGHVAAARAFMEQMWLDILYVIPSPQTPMDAVSLSQRVQMCRFAFSDVEGVYVSDAARSESDLMEIVGELEGPDRRLFLLCGTDELLAMSERKNVKALFESVYPTYVRREPSDEVIDARVLACVQSLHTRYGKMVRRILTPVKEISSTDIRRSLQQGDAVSQHLPALVDLYIRDNHLYV